MLSYVTIRFDHVMTVAVMTWSNLHLLGGNGLWFCLISFLLVFVLMLAVFIVVFFFDADELAARVYGDLLFNAFGIVEGGGEYSLAVFGLGFEFFELGSGGGRLHGRKDGGGYVFFCELLLVFFFGAPGGREAEDAGEQDRVKDLVHGDSGCRWLFGDIKITRCA